MFQILIILLLDCVSCSVLDPVFRFACMLGSHVFALNKARESKILIQCNLLHLLKYTSLLATRMLLRTYTTGYEQYFGWMN